MTRTVTIEVYCDTANGERELFGVASEHRPDLPNPFDKPLQEWGEENVDHLETGDSIEETGELESEPSGKDVEFRKR